MHRALYFLVRRAPVTTIKCTICICANVSLRGITVYSAGWGIFRKSCFCNYSGCSNGPSNVPKREHVSQPKRDRERECENAFIFESEVFRRFAFFEFWKIDQINVSKKSWCRAKSHIFCVSFLAVCSQNLLTSKWSVFAQQWSKKAVITRFHSAETHGASISQCWNDRRARVHFLTRTQSVSGHGE